MKRYVLTLIILLPLYCSAQLERWTLYMGGAGSFTRQDVDYTYPGSPGYTNENTSITFFPRIGFFPINKLLVGVSSDLSLSKTTSTSSFGGTSKSNSIAIGPFVRYYIYRGLYAQGEYFFGKGETSITLFNGASVTNIESESDQGGYSVGPGYSLFLNKGKSVALDMSVVYRNNKTDYPAVDSRQKGMQVTIGVSGFLNLIDKK